MLGGLLVHKQTGLPIPIYSTHISASNANGSQLNDLDNEVRRHFQKFWLPPLVVGDFNSHKWKANDWDKMKKNFSLMNKTPLNDRIEHTWIGKKTLFDNRYNRTYTIQDAKFLKYFNDHGNELSDHSVPFIVYRIEESKCTSFNPKTLKYVRTSIVHGIGNKDINMLFSKETDAKKAMQIIQHYDLVKKCEVGQLNYFLTREGKLPSGYVSGENCQRINYQNLIKIKNSNNTYSIKDKTSGKLIFSAQTENEAIQIIALIKKYRARYSCSLKATGIIGSLHNAGLYYLKG